MGITCNKCKKELTPDLIMFEGSFKDYFTMNPLHICRDCIIYFRDMLQVFLGTEIPEDEPVDISEHRIADRKKKKPS